MLSGKLIPLKTLSVFLIEEFSWQRSKMIITRFQRNEASALARSLADSYQDRDWARQVAPC